LLPESLLSYSVRDGVVAPHFLTAADHPWLRALLDEHARFVGRRERELDERLREPLGPAAAPAKQRLAVHLLRRTLRTARPAGLEPRRVREVLFPLATAAPSRAAALAGAAARLGVPAGELVRALFADLPGERLVAEPSPLSPAELALRVNLAQVQALVARALRVVIEVDGQARLLVRHARLRGLICTVEGRSAAGARLVLSGPFALFRHTLLYGRALAGLVPHLAWCRRFRLRADCRLRRRDATLVLGPADPIVPAAEPRAYDSRLEERFARDFRRAAPDWDLVREPEPVRAGGALVFPDFALVDRRDPRRRFLLEIVGFWTPDYLARKLAHLRAAGLANLVLCIDEERQCADGDLPPATVVRYRRRIDPAAVLRAITAP
jgi:predicted nuclease of restriction endonuclease-like RecB superfamily